MSSSAATVPPPLTADLLSIVVASVSCIALLIVILTLVVVLYRKEPLCFAGGLYHESQHYTDAPLQYNSSHSLIGFARNERSAAVNQGATGPQLPGGVFVIGKPRDYHLDGRPPRLPSYESVRKKDRQRQIHSMIAQRFGLPGRHSEPPPTYEETIHQSVDISPVDLRFLDVHRSIRSNHSSHLSEDTCNPGHHSLALQGPASSYGLAQSPSHGVLLM